MKEINELKVFLKSVLKNWLIIISSGILGFILFSIVSTRIETSYQYSQPIFITTQVNIPANNQSLYFNPSAKDPTDTVIGMLPNLELKSVSSGQKIEVNKIAAQLVSFNLISPSQHELAKQAEMVIDESNQKLANLTASSDMRLSLQPINRGVVTTNEPPIGLFLLIGFLLGATVGIATVLVKIYLSPPSKN